MSQDLTKYHERYDNNAYQNVWDHIRVHFQDDIRAILMMNHVTDAAISVATSGEFPASSDEIQSLPYLTRLAVYEYLNRFKTSKAESPDGRDWTEAQKTIEEALAEARRIQSELRAKFTAEDEQAEQVERDDHVTVISETFHDKLQALSGAELERELEDMDIEDIEAGAAAYDRLTLSSIQKKVEAQKLRAYNLAFELREVKNEMLISTKKLKGLLKEVDDMDIENMYSRRNQEMIPAKIYTALGFYHYSPNADPCNLESVMFTLNRHAKKL